MPRMLGVLATISLLVSLTNSAVLAHAPDAHVNGGGTGSFGADLDGDSQEDGSQFGMGVNLFPDGSAGGYFNCLMAGRSQFLGLALMAVRGQVTAGVSNPDGSVSFSGVGTVNLGPDGHVTDTPFEVIVTAGGPGVGTLQLTVIHPGFDGLPGDTNPGDGRYNLPLETVTSGQIKIH